ncbi:phenylalanine--tRNA ligase subunit beta [Kocuria flava]|uniref:Phenylalanine--tRNA ligase beta subunit n=1 Tax=Kocuria flava TaxID=446860 RepID=A0A0U3HA47_9MICC|nr:phenylalanine--tRNA ligase subunit beta [Kocuria flava]ALU39797.1 phenylalanine--tRNA ligase subunit beta [Kocuria flava]GEO92664.1 phenylalanine--tRNA ligase beta subunit [Kocuria flava]
MRVPVSWLREHAPVPEGATAEDVLATLIRVGFEEEAVHRPADGISGPVVVGQVLTKEPETHSNGKTVNWCTVRVVPEGQEQTLTGKGIDPSGVQGVICGAHNFEVGDKVVVTLPGAVLPGNFRISARKTYGHTSAGMIASVRELGIGEDHDGILVLSTLGLDPELGTDALELLGLHDEAAEINVTPDRGYAFSVRGVAREYCHAVRTPFADPALAIGERVPAPTAGGFPVAVDDDAPIHGNPGCTRFTARTVTGIDPTAPTPPWLAARLRLAGIRSISLPVDISNYVMLELGQPLHFYDLARLTGGITVRRARAGEELTTLDGRRRTLDPEDLLITDGSGPIGLAGVMGGATTEVSGTTVDVLVEAARFDEVSIARTTRRHRLPSEASKRFERGVDPQIAPVAAQRAVELLVELAGGTAVEEATDLDRTVAPRAVELPRAYPARRVGVDYPAETVAGLLTELGASVSAVEDGWSVVPPTWRPDLTAPEDLVEEIARLDGYDNIPSRLPVAPPGGGLTDEQRARKQVADALAAAGLVEVLAYPFVAQADNELWGAPRAGVPVPSVKLANPISEAQGVLRVSLLPGLLDVLRRNTSRGFRDLALYELGRVFRPGEQVGSAEIPPLGARPAEEVLAQLEAGLPAQPRHLAAVLAGRDAAEGPWTAPRALDWQDALDAARLAAEVLGVELTVRQGTHQAFHPGRTAVLATADGTPAGYAGELHPKLVAAQDLPERTVAMELNLTTLLAARGGVRQARPISGYPAATQDVALVVDAAVPAGDLHEALVEGAGELLEDVRVFDVYRGPGIEDGKKSVAFALRFRAPDRTLTAEEASAAREAAVAVAAERHGAVLRG